MTVSERLHLARADDGRVVAGVCAGVAGRFGLDVSAVRFAALVLALAGGVGVVAYVVAWAVLPVGPPPAAPVASSALDTVAVMAVAVGAALVLRAVGIWFGDAVALVGGAAAAGLTLAWSGEAGRGRGRALRIALGVALAAAGFVGLLAFGADLGTLGRTLLVAGLAAAGVGLLVGPTLARSASEAAAERQARARSDERAAIAAHLHDSVLQTLALIQKRADDPRAVVSLARRQERELRAWLHGDLPSPGTLADALAGELAVVEDDLGVRVELVTVGDAPADEAALALVGAVREAVTNAARHAAAPSVDVYVEAEEDTLVAYVRDRGRGFDPAAVPGDRHGIAESIVGRVGRAGGVATVRSAPGTGTEVSVRVPRRRP